MRSGMVGESGGGEGEKEVMRAFATVIRVLMEEAGKSAALFSEACGRRQVTGKDMVIALKYEAMVFWDKDTDSRMD